MTTTKDALPELPQRFAVWKETDEDSGAWGRPDQDVFTADQMRAYALAALASKQAPAHKDQATWCGYIAGMIGTYLRWPIDDARLDAITSIIERRLWSLPAPTQPEPAASDRDATAELTDAQIDALMPTGEAQVLWFDPRTRFGPEPSGKIIDASMAFMSSAPLGTKLFSREEVRATVRAAIAATQEQKP